MATRLIEELPTSEPALVIDWIERFEQSVLVHDAYLRATDADQRNIRKVALFLSCIGQDGYRLLKAYLAPNAPNTRTYDELQQCIRNNLAPQTSAISESYKLSQIKQATSESLPLFMSRVKLSATKCAFGDSYDRMARDRFICGLRSEKLRAHLINDNNLQTSQQALERAIARENSETAAHSMNVNKVSQNKYYDRSRRNQYSPNTQNQSNQKFQGDRRGDNVIVCTKCTLRGHKAPDCRTKCRYCKERFHIKANCGKLKKKRKVKHVDAEDGSISSDADDESDTKHNQ